MNEYAHHAERKAHRELCKALASKAATLEEKIAKLPKWASDHITSVTRERDVAIKALNRYIDDQTPSCISIQEMLCTGENGKTSFKTRYIQADEVRLEAHGLYVAVRIGFDRKEINVSYGSGPYLSTGECALIPTSYQQFKLITKANIRD